MTEQAELTCVRVALDPRHHDAGATVHEPVERTDCAVSGRVPAGLAGRHVTLDGLAHEVTFANGSVWYRSERSPSDPGDHGARVKTDPRTGERHWIDASATEPEITYGVSSAAGDTTFVTKIGLPKPALVHDFAITETSTVFVVPPLVFSAGGALEWEPELGTRVGVLARGADGLQTRWTKTDAFFLSHVANAWTEHGATYVDFVHYDSATTAATAAVPHLHRLRVDRAGKIAQAPLDATPCEIPRIDDRCLGRRHRYAYYPGRVDGRDGTGHDAVVRYDTELRTTVARSFGTGAAVGEPVFVPRAANSAEDEGWVLVPVSGAAGTTDLVVLDAASFGRGPLARVHLPAAVAPGRHAHWYPAA